ncbi:M12 family metallopeptidase [Aquimarina mytili]|uniref:Peptidase M12A domain-containing protein n=1 Tax=Aquimarina mytili TaxID=874423 RepID=A0A936ZZ36_9FLAO|nr:M12 family metallopeptidase [Aquimarina mytili]MBL0684540.1 hypothetical protein [Aquimarina mytili]
MQTKFLFLIMAILVVFGCEKLDDNEVSTETSIDTEITTSDGNGEIITLESKTLGTLAYERINGQNILEGDIILTDEQVNAFKNADVEDNVSKSAPGIIFKQWPNSRVNYWIETSNAETRDNIYWVVRYLEDKTNLDFIERRSGNYIAFVESNGCSSFLGMIGGRQEIKINSEFCKSGTILHELLHALGIFHEQSRPDRNQYININYSNIRPGFEHNFTTQFTRNYGPFDFGSIMIYNPCNFSISSSFPFDDCTSDKATITRKNGSLYPVNESYLSYIDRNALLDMYPKDVRSAPTGALDIGANDRGDWVYTRKNGRYIEAVKHNRVILRYRESNSNTSIDITQYGQMIFSGETFTYGSGRYSRHTIVDISEGGGNIYGVARNGNSHKLFKKEGNNWIFVQRLTSNYGRARVSVDGYGRPWTIINNQINGWVYGQPKIIQKPKGFDQNFWSFYDIACSGNSEIFVSMKRSRRTSSTLFRFSIRHSILVQQPPINAKQFDVGGSNGTIWY